MSGLILTVTDAGRAALVNASNTGTNPVLMASVGVSATSFTPSPATTILPDEIKRITTIAGEAVADDTMHVTVRDESADLYTVRSFGLYLADGTLFAVYSQADPIMEKSAQALLLLTIDVIFADIEATDITFGDASFSNPPATTTRQGVVELATEAETETGSDAIRAVTPKGLKTAVTQWLNDRFGEGAPSSFIKELLTSASAAALRLSLGLKSAALKDEGADKGLDADKLDGEHGTFYRNAANLNAGTLPSARLSGTYNISVSGNAATATKLATARTLSLTGDVTGSASFDGSANAGISVTLAAAKVLEKLRTVDGSGSGLDADLLDGYHAAAFARLTGADFTSAISVPLGNGYRIGGTLVLSRESDESTQFLTCGTSNFVIQNAARNANILHLTSAGSLTVAGAIIANNGSVMVGAGHGYWANGRILLTDDANATWLYGGAAGYKFRNAANNAVLLSIADSGGAWFAGPLTRAGGIQVWDSGNDGSGSGLDADLLDGHQGSYYLPASSYSAADVKAKLLTVDGSGSGLDADLLDGLHAADFAKLADFVASKATNGYCRLPNGMIIQAGRYSQNANTLISVVFPLAFPNMCMGVVTNGTGDASFGAEGNTPTVYSNSVTTGGFQSHNANDNSTTAYFIAFGY